MKTSKIIKNHRFRFVLFFILFSGMVNSQTDYYVSAINGSDSNDGLSESTPFKTINKGIFMVNAGGTVFVMNGTYQNDGYGTVDVSTNTNMSNPHVVTIDKSGSEGAYITLKNYPGHNPKIQFDGKGGIIIDDFMNYIIIEGFEVEGPAASITYDQAIADREYKVLVAGDDDDATNYNHAYFSGKGIWGGYKAHHHIIIRNNVVHDTTGSGIRFNDSDHITIEYNEVYNTTWWTSSASSAVVFAETIAASEDDNGTDIKMIMRGNLVYNNWNRIPFYTTQLPDNSGNTNPNYGTANYNSILDGQGLYVTRSDDNYYGTFLFENNVCVNNGKNGINFDNSLGASAIYQNNTLYYNGVHEIIQDLSAQDGNRTHRGQNVAGIKANKVQNATVVNNIIVTRENIYEGILSSDFEESNEGWSSWGPASVSLSSNESRSGSQSLNITGRSADWHSPKIDLDDLGNELTLGQKYKLSVWVKLEDGSGNGTSQLSLRKTVDGNSFSTSLGSVSVSSNNWTQLTGNFTYEATNDFIYVRGPTTGEGLADFYIDDFSIDFQRNYSALSLNNIDNPFTNDPNDGLKVASNNIFLNGSVAYPGNQEPANQINVNPEFVSVPTLINGPVDINQINLELLSNSPAINAGNPNYSPALDFNGNPRPSNATDAISYSSFENSTDGWTDFGGATIVISDDESLTGDKSLFITDRTLNYSSPRLFLDGLLTMDATYTFYVNVKLAPGASGTSNITIKNTLDGNVTYTNLYDTPLQVSSENWMQLSGDFTYTGSDQIFVYIKGPTIGEGLGNFYIDDFSLVPEGSGPVNFTDINDVVDIGAYEFTASLSTDNNTVIDNTYDIYGYPNPASTSMTLLGISAESTIQVFDLLGKPYQIKIQSAPQTSSTVIDISGLARGMYIIKIENNKTRKTIKFIKQ